MIPGSITTFLINPLSRHHGTSAGESNRVIGPLPLMVRIPSESVHVQNGPHELSQTQFETKRTRIEMTLKNITAKKDRGTYSQFKAEIIKKNK